MECAADPATTRRRQHYGDFYGADRADEADRADRADDGRPVALVWGNCQAESVRVLLARSPTFPLRTVRVPPVHELRAEDLAPLAALLPRVALLLSQPVRRGYRGLPIGTADLTDAIGARVPVRRWPVVRYIGLCPYAAIVRHPADPATDPPAVPYHDLRTLARAAGRRRRRAPSAPTLRAVAEASVAELARREHEGTDVGVSDLLLSSGAEATHTLNHPGNRILIALARRLQRAVGAPADADDPGRQLLGHLRAPLEADVVEALGLDATPRPAWDAGGVPIEVKAIEEQQLEWYGTNAACVEAGLRRHGNRMALLGL